MANKILLKKSSVITEGVPKAPEPGDLEYGELALNYAAGRLYYKKADNTIDSFPSAAAGQVTSVDGNTGDITATQLLTAIKKVDGTGSGLDADLLDGLDSTAYAKSGNNTDIISLTPDYIDFDTTVTITPQEGRVFWDNVDGAKTLSIGMADGVTQQIGQETYFRVKATAPITNGQVVMATGTQGASGVITAAPATGLTPETGVYVIGIATQDIALNSWGYVTSFGLVRGINTTGGAEAWTDGTVLYYNPAVPGGLTKTKPTAPNAIVLMAMVVYAASNGSLFVRPSYGSVLGGTDGNVQITSLATGDVLKYMGTRWENVKLAQADITGLKIADSPTFTGLTLSGGTANGVSYFNANKELVSESALTFDGTNFATTGTASALDFNSTSDRNKKTNIVTITDPIEKVQALRGVTFNWRSNGSPAIGLIAQEVEEIVPQAVQGDEGNKTISYGSLVGLLIEAIKELDAKVEELKNRDV